MNHILSYEYEVYEKINLFGYRSFDIINKDIKCLKNYKIKNVNQYLYIIQNLIKTFLMEKFSNIKYSVTINFKCYDENIINHKMISEIIKIIEPFCKDYLKSLYPDYKFLIDKRNINIEKSIIAEIYEYNKLIKVFIINVERFV